LEYTQPDVLIAVRVSKKGKDFYYLLPGMGRGARQRYWRNLKISVAVGILLSGLMWWLCWLIYK
jgi:hypothetical protein